MLKSEQNSSITKNINSANCLEINYYDPYGNKVVHIILHQLMLQYLLVTKD